jgi:predicted AAA+ superfamily ATPase
VNTYLREEIQAEQVIRNVPVFRAFIEVAGQSSGKILNYSKLARDVGTDPVTVKNYFSVLEDTLLGFFLPAFRTSIRKRQSLHPKFYFFDLGVLNAAQGLLTVPVAPQTSRYGELFESFVILEIHRLSQYLELDWKLSYLMTHGKVEVDLIVDRPGQKRAFIEIKSTSEVRDDHLRSLMHFQEEFADTEFFLISQDPRERKVGQILCLHWKNAFREIGLREA